jgi:lipopolysaccharide biosynthesis glycosyltransferase
MTISVCTLFENDLHLGLGALINSLEKNSFKGSLFAGYRGSIPTWVKMFPSVDLDYSWKGKKIIKINEDLLIHFLPLEIDIHFCNYKPTFMLKIFDEISPDIDGLIYFDPDIVVKCEWGFFERWISYGIALVHEISGIHMRPNHPLRKQWEKEVLPLMGKTVNQHLSAYFNSGFCGILKENKGFLKEWECIIHLAINNFGLGPNEMQTRNRQYLFQAADQDALNIAAMSSIYSLTEMGPEAMDFIPNGHTMSHATGMPKPWKKDFLLSIINGVPPTMADKEYWKNTDGPIRIYKKSHIIRKNLVISLASMIGRFYRRQ